MFRLGRVCNIVEVEGAFSGFVTKAQSCVIPTPKFDLRPTQRRARARFFGNTGIFHPRKPSNPAHRSLKKRNTLEALKITLEAATL
jgi:hypothetical protein